MTRSDLDYIASEASAHKNPLFQSIAGKTAETTAAGVRFADKEGDGFGVAYEKPASKGGVYPTLKDLEGLAALGLGNTRRALAGIRPTYDYYRGHDMMRVGCETRYQGRCILKQGESNDAQKLDGNKNYQSPDGVLDSLELENSSWKVKDEGLVPNEWEEDSIQLAKPIAFNANNMSARIGTIEGIGGWIRVPQLDGLLGIHRISGTNKPQGTIERKLTDKTLYGTSIYPSVAFASYEYSSLSIKANSIGGYDSTFNNPISASVYFSVDESQNDEGLAISHTVRNIGILIQPNADAYAIEGNKYTLGGTIWVNKEFFLIEDWNRYTEAAFKWSQLQRARDSHASNEFYQEAITIWNEAPYRSKRGFDVGGLGTPFPTFALHFVGQEAINSKPVFLSKGTTYNIYVSFSQIEGTPSLQSLSFQKCRLKRKPIQISGWTNNQGSGLS